LSIRHIYFYIYQCAISSFSLLCNWH